MSDDLTRAIAEALDHRHHLNTADLAAHIAAALTPVIERTVAAAAWQEGYTSGHSNAMRRMSDEPNAPSTPNPYREEARDE